MAFTTYEFILLRLLCSHTRAHNVHARGKNTLSVKKTQIQYLLNRNKYKLFIFLKSSFFLLRRSKQLDDHLLVALRLADSSHENGTLSLFRLEF